MSTLEHINTFTGGMNKDLSENLVPDNTFIDGRNIRINSKETNGLLGGISNIKSPTLSCTIPTVPNLYKGNLDLYGVIVPEGTYSVNLKYKIKNDARIRTVLITGGGGHDGLMLRLNNLHLTTTNSDYIEDGMRFYSTSNVTYKAISLNRNIDDYWFEDSASGAILANNAEEYLPAQTQSIVIGQIDVKNETYLFTCNKYAYNTPSNGQIWKLTNNKEVKNGDKYTIELLYLEALNFYLTKPITGVGIYENEVTTRLYFTDGINPVRTFTIGNIDNFGILPGLLELQPSVNTGNIKLLREVSGGTNGTGVYQYSYRLIKDNVKTKLAIPTKPHFLLSASSDSGVNWKYQDATELSGVASGVASGKSMQIELSGLDTSYNQVELICMYRANKLSTPYAFIVETQQINANGINVIEHSGNETAIPLSSEELTLFGASFSHAKVLETKDNILFAANVSTATYSNLEFNARAYRFNSSGNTYPSINSKIQEGITHGDVNWGINVSDGSATQTELDAINPNQSIYKYQRNGITEGGEGPNVSYEFVELAGVSGMDKLYEIADEAPITNNVGVDYFDTPVRDNEQYFTAGTLINDKPDLTNNQIANFKSPYCTSVFKGYMPGETYRFGIVLFDNANSPSFVHWIGDIKIPERKPATFRGNYADGVLSGKYFMDLTNIGIRFTVNVSTIADLITGYSIVRVKREESDKTVLGNGMLFPMAEFDYSTKTKGLVTNKDKLSKAYQLYEEGYGKLIASKKNPAYEGHYNIYINEGNPQYCGRTAFSSNSIASTQVVSFDSPEVQLGNITPLPNDYIYPLYTINSNYFGKYGNWDKKWFDFIEKKKEAISDGYTSFALPLEIKQKGEGIQFNGKSSQIPLKIISGKVLNNGEYAVLNGKPILNATGMYGALGIGTEDDEQNFLFGHRSFGTKTLVCVLNSSINFRDLIVTKLVTDDGASERFDRLPLIYASYRRDVTDQYGGNTQEARSKNYFIPCNYISVSNTETSRTFDVYGGDCQTVVYGNTKLEKNRGFASNDLPIPLYQGDPSPDIKYCINASTSTIFIFPVQTSISAQYRYGYHALNKYHPTLNGKYPSADIFQDLFKGDEYKYYDLYEIENDIFTFFPKPTNSQFNLVNSFESRIYASDVKINGELFDSWRVFKPTNYIDLEQNKGPINGLMNYGNYLIAFQQDAVNAVVINPVSLTTDNLGNQVILGAGTKVLNNFRIIEHNKGIQNKLNTVIGEKGIYFFDNIRKRLYVLTGQQTLDIPEVKGMNSYFNNLNNSDISKFDLFLNKNFMVYDYDYKEVLIQNTLYTETYVGIGKMKDFPQQNTKIIISDSVTAGNYYKIIDSENNQNIIQLTLLSGNRYIPTTPITLSTGDVRIFEMNNPIIDALSFNESLGVFNGIYNHTPDYYFTNKIQTSLTRGNGLYTLNEGNYGDVLYTPSLTLVTNLNPNMTKTFNNLHFDYRVFDSNNLLQKGFNLGKLRVRNDFQNTDYYEPNTNGIYSLARNVEGEWRTQIPRDRVVDSTIDIFEPANLQTIRFAQRIRGKFAKVDIIFDKLLYSQRMFLGYIKSVLGVSER